MLRSGRREAESYDLHADADSVSSERLDVGSVSSEDGAAWLGDRNHECIHGRACSGKSAEFGCSAWAHLICG